MPDLPIHLTYYPGTARFLSESPLVAAFEADSSFSRGRLMAALIVNSYTFLASRPWPIPAEWISTNSGLYIHSTYHSDFVCNQPHVLVIARTRRQLLFELLVSATPDKRLLECISPIHSAKKLVDYDHPANLQQLVAGLSRHQFLVSDRRFL